MRNVILTYVTVRTWISGWAHAFVVHTNSPIQTIWLASCWNWKKKEKNNKMNAMGIILEENTESWTKQRKEITAETKAQITWRRNKFPTFAWIVKETNKQTNKQKPQNNEKKLTCRSCGRCFAYLQSTRLTRKQKKFRSNPNHGFTQAAGFRLSL